METLITPPALRPGDCVAVVAPSGPAPPEELTAGLTRLGARYQLRPSENLFAHQGYLAGDDGRRLEGIERALRDPAVRAIFCARGGYGVQRILADLDGDLLRADPKIICGFSDITALLSWTVAQGVVAIHGPVVTQMARLPAGDLAHLFALLERPELVVTLQGSLLPGASEAVEGPLIGGNLSLLGALAGSPWAPRLEDALLAIEDVSEPPYRVDRLLTTLLHQDGVKSAAGVRGVALGEFSDCGPGRRGGPTVLGVIAERLARAGRPLVSALPFGHGERNVALPFGARARLDPTRGTLSWEGGVVARP